MGKRSRCCLSHVAETPSRGSWALGGSSLFLLHRGHDCRFSLRQAGLAREAKPTERDRSRTQKGARTPLPPVSDCSPMSASLGGAAARTSVLQLDLDLVGV